MSGHAGYDVIVLGLGGWGSAITARLAQRGQRVLGIDRYTPPHDKGSSHGHSRLIRVSSVEHPSYTPIMQRSYELWHDLEQATGLQVFTRTGGISFGPPDEEVIRDLPPAYEPYGLPYQWIERDEARSRYPMLRLEPGEVVILDESAGILHPERAVEAHLALARQYGAELLLGAGETHWEASAAAVHVRTEVGEYSADRLVLAAGAWMPDLLGYPLNLQVERQVMLWWQPRSHPEWFRAGTLPWFIGACDPPYEIIYGVPDMDGEGVKFGMHRGGQLGHIDAIERDILPEDIAVVRGYIQRRMPELEGTLLNAKTCVYTNTPDRHFVIGSHPLEPRVVVAGGGSGRGFKFCAVIGEIVADLVIDGATRHDIALLAPTRPAVRT
ncbi:MAG: N-methyl-L-tryptophan oxidase [Chloroflexi bacterium]|nr:MAG: N-methyl-L-tryptophan oxidase [Chloroflexota bacterium]